MAESLYPGSASVNPLMFGAAMQPIVQGAVKGLDIYAQMRRDRLNEEVQAERLAALARQEERLLQDRLTEARDAGAGGSSGRASGGGGGKGATLGSDLNAQYANWGLLPPPTRSELALQGQQEVGARGEADAALAQRQAALNPSYLTARGEQQSLEVDPGGDAVQMMLNPRRLGAAVPGEGELRRVAGQQNVDPLAALLQSSSATGPRARGSFNPLAIGRGPEGLANPWTQVGMGAEYTGTNEEAVRMEAQGKAPEGFGDAVRGYNSHLDIAMGREEQRVAGDVAERVAARRIQDIAQYTAAIPNMRHFKGMDPEDAAATATFAVDHPEAFKAWSGQDADSLQSGIAASAANKKERRLDMERKERYEGHKARFEADAQALMRQARLDGFNATTSEEEDAAAAKFRSAEDDYKTADARARALSSSSSAGKGLGGAAGTKPSGATEAGLRARMASNPGLANLPPNEQAAALDYALIDSSFADKWMEGRIGVASQGDQLAEILDRLIPGGGDPPITTPAQAKSAGWELVVTTSGKEVYLSPSGDQKIEVRQ